MTAHPQSIQIHARLVFDDERSFHQLLEIRDGAFVDHVGVRIGAGWQLELRTRHAQKTCGVAVGERARFVGGDDVVGDGGDARRFVRLRTQRTERRERGHRGSDYIAAPIAGRLLQIVANHDRVAQPAQPKRVEHTARRGLAAWRMLIARRNARLRHSPFP